MTETYSLSKLHAEIAKKGHINSIKAILSGSMLSEKVPERWQEKNPALHIFLQIKWGFLIVLIQVCALKHHQFSVKN